MKKSRFSILMPFLISFISISQANARIDSIQVVKKTAETQIRHLVEPLLDKYCHDECKLLTVDVTVDTATQDEVAPGFDEVEISNSNELAPSTARLKLLINDKIGPVSRSKLLELIQQFVDTLEYPVKIDTQIAHFPIPQGSEGKIAEIRERIEKEFTASANDLLKQFCPSRCIFTDFQLQTDLVNGEEAQYGSSGEFVQDGNTTVKIKNISATLLMDESLSPIERNNILEMIKLKTSNFHHVSLTGKSMKFPEPDLGEEGSRGLASTRSGKGKTSSTETKNASTSNSKSVNTNTNSEEVNKSETKSEANNKTESNNKTEATNKQEIYQRIEKIERVENGDAVQEELKKFKVIGLIFGCSILALLIFIALASYRQRDNTSTVHRVLQNLADPGSGISSDSKGTEGRKETSSTLPKRYEIEVLLEELTSIYAQQPRVAKQVFSRILTEEGVEVTAECIHLFGEGIVVEMLRDPSLQTDLTELMEYYAKNPIELSDDEKLDLLKKLHNRTIAGKLVVMGNRSSNLFDFLAEMDGLQIMELIRTESITVKAIILTQCDTQKRAAIYAQMEPELRMQLLSELSRIDYLPRDYIFNVAHALKRKRRENPKLNTEALPGSDVLVSLLERTGQDIQKSVVKNLEVGNPESARTVKSKLVSTETLRYLRDGQLLEVILSLKHEELIQFLKGAPNHIRKAIFAKSPKELVAELEEEVGQASVLSRETFQTVERKIINRMKILANEGLINLVETNERMFAEQAQEGPFVQANPAQTGKPEIRKVAGW